MERDLKRISLHIGEDQYDEIGKRKLNLSWLVRELIDNYLNQNSITLDVSQETRELYEQIVGTNGEDMDKDFEPLLREALKALLKIKIEKMQQLAKTAFSKKGGE
ncbi:MAG: hypothetical protein IT287_06145 [Bdellovibrionaceae bacterium]|nr:hypothetical protein [Pseudobdellovibrionaceae bacterium]